MSIWIPEPEYAQNDRPLADLLASAGDAIDGAPHDVLGREQRTADLARLGHLDHTTWPARN